MLTLSEFSAIYESLRRASETWADLWICLSDLPISIGELIGLRYSSVKGARLFIEHGRDGGRRIIEIPVNVRKIICRRRKDNPEDIYIFQSHSNRVGTARKPVTIIAFNSAIKKSATGITHKIVSSSSAKQVQS